MKNINTCDGEYYDRKVENNVLVNVFLFSTLSVCVCVCLYIYISGVAMCQKVGGHTDT